MGKVIAGITMSLDGYINDGDGSVEKLYPDFVEMHDVPFFQEMIAATGAVVMGRGAYEMADPEIWADDDYEFQTPIFVLTHTPPAKYPKGNGKLSFTFVVDGVASAIAQAKRAANGKDVQVIGGANTLQQCLSSGLCDELYLDVVPVLLGDGRRLFENIDAGAIRLERIKTEEATPSRTSLVFKVTRA